MTRSRYQIGESEYPYFLTCTIVSWLPVFSHADAVAIVLDSWRYLQDKRHLLLFGYVILENHLHFIASSEELSKDIGDFKSFTSRQIIDLFEQRRLTGILDQLKSAKAAHKTNRPHQLWQEGSHPQMIQNEEMMRQKLDYVHYNPVKRDYVDDPAHWRYSSARNYLGEAGLIGVTTEW